MGSSPIFWVKFLHLNLAVWVSFCLVTLQQSSGAILKGPKQKNQVIAVSFCGTFDLASRHPGFCFSKISPFKKTFCFLLSLGCHFIVLVGTHRLVTCASARHLKVPLIYGQLARVANWHHLWFLVLNHHYIYYKRLPTSSNIQVPHSAVWSHRSLCQAATWEGCWCSYNAIGGTGQSYHHHISYSIIFLQ